MHAEVDLRVPGLGGRNRKNVGGRNRKSIGSRNRKSLGGRNRKSLGGRNRKSLGGSNRKSHVHYTNCTTYYLLLYRLALQHYLHY